MDPGRRPIAAAWCAATLAACAAGPYSPCHVSVAGGLPASAFGVCQEVLRQHYGPLAIADAARFLLQTDWVAIDEPPGERRASIFRGELPGDLAVVVEVRRLTEPMLGVPHWTEPRGWDAAERELAGWLRDALGH